MATAAAETNDQSACPAALRILYVDDSPFDRGLVRDALTVEEEGFELVEADSQTAFEERLGQGRYDLVLSDFNILGFEGLQVIDAVKGRYPGTPVVIVTGTGSEEIAVKAMKRGAADYVIKTPQHIRRLPQTIRCAIERRDLERQRHQMKRELRRRLQMQAALADLSRSALSVPNIQDLLEEAVRRLAETLKAELCKVLELSDDSQSFLLRAGVGWHDGLVGQARVDAGSSSQAGFTLRCGKPVAVEDLASEARFQGSPLLRDHRVVSGMSVVIPGQQRAYGVLGVHTISSRRFSSDDVQFVQAVANVLAEAIEWRRAEGLLRRSEQLFREITENAQDIVTTLGKRGHFRYVSPSAERILGYAPHDLIGQKALAYVHPDDRKKCLDAFNAFLSKPGSSAVEFRFLCQDGSWKTLESLGKSLLANPSVAGIVVHSRDITQIREAEAHNKALLEAIPDVIVRLDRQANVLDFKPAAGYEPVKNLGPGDNLTTLVSAETARRGLEHIRQALKTGQTQLFEFQMGGKHPAYRESRIVAWSEDEVIAMVRDITERHHAEEALRESERRYRMLAETAHDLIIVHDARGRITYCNNQCLKATGYEQSEILEFHAQDILPAKPQSDGRKPRGDDPFLYETLLLKRDGGTIPVEVSACSFDSEMTLLIARDISERKQAQLRIQQQASLLDEVQDAVLVRDLEGRITHWNRSAERIYQWTAEEVMGRHTEEFLISRSQSDLDEAFNHVLQQGKWGGKLSQKRKDGNQVVVQSRWKLLIDDDGLPCSVLVVNTDLTEQQRIEDQFLRSQRMENVGTLAGGIAHDLNNMLEPILLSAGLLQMQAQNAKSLKYIATMESSAKRASSLVRQLLAFARGSNGERTRFDPKHLLAEVEQILFQTIPRTITIKKSFCQDLRPVVGNITQIHQVLLNLGVNARDAMPHGGLLKIEAENQTLEKDALAPDQPSAPGDYVTVRVTDTGFGMTPGVQERIFEPFFTTKEAGKGTGLGLSTVQSIVKSHNGFLRVQSQVGKGTTVQVFLPAEAGTVDAGQIPVRRGLPRGDGSTVLFVDDEPSILETARATLEAYGYRVLTACDGTHAVSVYIQNAEAIDVVITDLMMLFMDGPSTIRALRKLDSKASFVAVSGLPSAEADDELRLPGVSCLSKPYTTEELLLTIHTALARDSQDLFDRPGVSGMSLNRNGSVR